MFALCSSNTLPCVKYTLKNVTAYLYIAIAYEGVRHTQLILS